MILKLLTIIFLTIGIINLFTNNKLIKDIFKGTFKPINNLDLDNKEELEDNKETVTKAGLKLLPILTSIILIELIKFITMISLVSYDTQLHILLIYLLLYILNFIYSNITTINNKKKRTKANEIYDEINKTTIKSIIVNILSVAYWGYVFYLLFI